MVGRTDEQMDGPTYRDAMSRWRIWKEEDGKEEEDNEEEDDKEEDDKGVGDFPPYFVGQSVCQLVFTFSALLSFLSPLLLP